MKAYEDATARAEAAAAETTLSREGETQDETQAPGTDAAGDDEIEMPPDYVGQAGADAAAQEANDTPDPGDTANPEGSEGLGQEQPSDEGPTEAPTAQEGGAFEPAEAVGAEEAPSTFLAPSAPPDPEADPALIGRAADPFAPAEGPAAESEDPASSSADLGDPALYETGDDADPWGTPPPDTAEEEGEGAPDAAAAEAIAPADAAVGEAGAAVGTEAIDEAGGPGETIEEAAGEDTLVDPPADTGAPADVVEPMEDLAADAAYEGVETPPSFVEDPFEGGDLGEVGGEEVVEHVNEPVIDP